MVEGVNDLSYVVLSYGAAMFSLLFVIVLSLFQLRQGKRALKKIEDDLDAKGS